MRLDFFKLNKFFVWVFLILKIYWIIFQLPGSVTDDFYNRKELTIASQLCPNFVSAVPLGLNRPSSVSTAPTVLNFVLNLFQLCRNFSLFIPTVSQLYPNLFFWSLPQIWILIRGLTFFNLSNFLNDPNFFSINCPRFFGAHNLVPIFANLSQHRSF